MGRIAKPLTALEVGRLTKPGYQAVGTVPGLYLQVTDGGARSWVLRTMVGDKRRDIGLGAYPGITLSMAHTKARDMRQSILQGVDPIEGRKTAKSLLISERLKAVTFKTAADLYMTAKAAGFRNSKHRAQWRATVETHAFPILGNMLVRDVELPHVLAVLEPIWQTTTETASRLRGRIEKILDWATTRKYRTGLNPARWKGHLDANLLSPGKIKRVKHHPAVQVAEAGAFMKDLRECGGIGARGLEFAMLTAARSGEVFGATWGELDLDAGLWTVPDGRMKGERAHRVPLSDKALGILRELPRFADSDLVFVAPRGGMFSDMAFSAITRRLDYKDGDGRRAVPHGLRSTFRDWAAERTSYPPEVMEAALAHTKGDKVEAAYFRSDLFDKRRRLMTEWAAFLDNVEPKVATVTAINRKSA